MLHDELGLTAEQDKKFEETHKDFKNVAHGIFDKLEAKRILMIEELSKPKPDTVLLFKLSEDIGNLHGQLKAETVRHLLRLRAICNNKQLQKFNSFNKELIGPEGPPRKMEHRK
jgi:hypothetical protein